MIIECDQKNCSEEFDRPPSKMNDKNFCSKKCMGLYRRNRIESTCNHCGTKFQRPESNHRQGGGKYCSNKCKFEATKGENHHNWQGGSSSYFGTNWYQIRKRVLKRDNNKCLKCGAEECEDGTGLEVHHIKPRREFENPEDANYLDNLVTLCDKHHREIEILSEEEQKSILGL